MPTPDTSQDNYTVQGTKERSLVVTCLLITLVALVLRIWYFNSNRNSSTN